MSIQSLAVFCGSKCGSNPLFVSHAVSLGHLLAGKGVRLIYGGGNKGLMGSVANAVLEKNGQVTGIIPQLLTQFEHQHNGITELLIVEDMHVRKRMLYEKADAAIVLPGGFGTLDELYEMLTWNQLSIHNKKIFILNSAGFYDHLIAHSRMMEQENFLYERTEERMTILNEPQDLANFL